ncbi:MAG: hypothetical protein V1810_02365 [Candidatus Beckwithbacteria bacterium]
MGRKTLLKKLGVLLLISTWFLAGWPVVWQNPQIPPEIEPVYAAVSVTAATGGTSISADTYGTGSYTTLTGPTITEGANKDITAANKTIVLTVPSGFIFNTGATVTATISIVSGSGTCFTFSSTTATPTSTTITYTVTAQDSNKGPVCRVVFSNIQVRPTAGTPLASGDITNTGNNTSIPSGSTNFGTLTEVVGAKNKLAVTTQPSSPATVNTDFTTKPVVTLQDQYGNTVTTDNSSTVSTAVVLSTQTCGGTAGSGSLTSTPTSGTAVSSGILTYTAMQYSAAESIKICFSSSGVTSALSNTVTVNPVPIYSVSITPAGTISYGTIAGGGGNSKSTIDISATKTLQNDGNTTEKLSIKTTNATGGTQWTVGSTPGTNVYVHEFSTNSGGAWTKFTAADSYQVLIASIGVGNTASLDLRVTTPTSSDDIEKSITVTVLAETL